MTSIRETKITAVPDSQLQQEGRKESNLAERSYALKRERHCEFFQAGDPAMVNAALGNLRVHLARKHGLIG